MRRRPLRPIAAAFVVAAPSGARVRTRLVVNDTDAAVLSELARYLGSLAGHDLARRCREGPLDAKGRGVSRRERKRHLTTKSSSRWAGAITRTTEDSWQLGSRNLVAEGRSLRARCSRIEQRLAVPVGERLGRRRGYGSQAERFAKQQRLQVLRARLRAVESRLRAGRVSVCRGGARLAKVRHHLHATGGDEDAWRGRWESARMFITADGEADKAFGNETIRWHPDEQWLEIKLPESLSHLANRPHGRYRLSGAVAFSYRAAEVGAQAASGAVRYDVFFDPGRDRWYFGRLVEDPAVHRHLRRGAALRPGAGGRRQRGPSGVRRRRPLGQPRGAAPDDPPRNERVGTGPARRPHESGDLRTPSDRQSARLLRCRDRKPQLRRGPGRGA